MNELVVASRLMVTSSLNRVSRAGCSMRASDGSVHTVLFDNHDPNVVLLMDSMDEFDVHGRLYHVFVGRYLDRINGKDMEVFRLHGDIWPTSLRSDETPMCFGEEVHRIERLDRITRHSFEHLGGLFITDSTQLSCVLQAGVPPVHCSVDLIPDRTKYKALFPHLPHPGMIRDGNDTDAVEEWIRMTRPPKPVRVM
jgi:hypothetical protein